MSLRNELTDKSFRFAIGIGLLSIPVSLLLSWGSVPPIIRSGNGEFDAFALLVAGCIVGYHYHGRPTSTKRAGMWTGLVGSVAAVIVIGVVLINGLSSASSDVFGPIFVLGSVWLFLGVGLSTVLAVVGAVSTEWIGKRITHHRAT